MVILAKAKVVALEVPQTEQEADECLRQLGNVMRRREEVRILLNGVVEVNQQLAARADAPLGQKQEELVKKLAAFAEANRSRLAKGKTIQLPSGVLNWRLTPFKVTPRGKVAAILAELKRRRLGRFIRVKEELDREAMLREPEVAGKVPGISIDRREELYIQPLDLPVEIKATSEKVAATTQT